MARILEEHNKKETNKKEKNILRRIVRYSKKCSISRIRYRCLCEDHYWPESTQKKMKEERMKEENEIKKNVRFRIFVIDLSAKIINGR